MHAVRGVADQRQAMLDDAAGVMEVERIAALYPPNDAAVFLGSAASESVTRSDERFRQARILHFAVHGVVDERRPQLSGLVLSNPAAESADDGLLQAYEIAGMRLAAELATHNVDVFLVTTNRTAEVVRQRTTTIPIVMTSAEDPVRGYPEIWVGKGVDFLDS
jgi:CHAT domain-containing protein